MKRIIFFSICTIVILGCNNIGTTKSQRKPYAGTQTAIVCCYEEVPSESFQTIKLAYDSKGREIIRESIDKSGYYFYRVDTKWDENMSSQENTSIKWHDYYYSCGYSCYDDGKTVTEYDNNENVLKEEEYKNDILVRKKDYTYDKKGNLITLESLEPENKSIDLCRYKYDFDKKGRVLVQYESKNAAEFVEKRKNSYYDDGSYLTEYYMEEGDYLYFHKELYNKRKQLVRDSVFIAVYDYLDLHFQYTGEHEYDSKGRLSFEKYSYHRGPETKASYIYDESPSEEMLQLTLEDFIDSLDSFSIPGDVFGFLRKVYPNYANAPGLPTRSIVTKRFGEYCDYYCVYMDSGSPIYAGNEDYSYLVKPNPHFKKYDKYDNAYEVSWVMKNPNEELQHQRSIVVLKKENGRYLIDNIVHSDGSLMFDYSKPISNIDN